MAGLGRRFYLAVTVVLTAVEVFIALYVHDRFIRPYMGDVLVVIVLYCFVETIERHPRKHTPTQFQR